MSRKKKRGYSLPPGKFLTIPVEVLKDAAARLSATELRVFVTICAQSQPWSNGTAKLTRTVIREFHLGSTRVVTSAVRKLLADGFMRRTRRHRQHVCAMYAVKHMPLNLDALAKEGVSATTWEALDDESSATNRGSAAVRPHGKRYCDHIGSAEHENSGSARPHGTRKPLFSTLSARPHGTQSKNLPSVHETLGAALNGPHGSGSGSDSAPLGAPKRGRPRSRHQISLTKEKA